MTAVGRRRMGVLAVVLAALAVVSATVGVVRIVDAAGGGSAASFLPISPCRLADTRASGGVGTRRTPIGAGETVTFTVWGSRGNCTIPTSATGITANVTIVNPTASAFLTMWPADVARPEASSLNYVDGQAPTPNAVTVTLSADGKIKAFNSSGTVDVIIDIAGYYQVLPDMTDNGRNHLTREQIAMLRWDRSPQRLARVNSVSWPLDLAFDGESIWVVGYIAEQVQKVDAETDETLATVDVAGGPQNIVFDGTYIWVTSRLTKTIVRIDPASAKVTGTVAVEAEPGPMTVDRGAIWMIHKDADKVSRIDPSKLEVTATVSVGSHPMDITFDGTWVWVTNRDSNSLSRIDPSTRAVTTVASCLPAPNDIATDGTNLWVLHPTSGMVARFHPSSGCATSEVVSAQLSAVVYDGYGIWITDQMFGRTLRLDPQTLEVTSGALICPIPTALIYDGTWIWATCTRSQNVTKILPL